MTIRQEQEALLKTAIQYSITTTVELENQKVYTLVPQVITTDMLVGQDEDTLEPVRFILSQIKSLKF
jgi:hypothetical protein